MNDTNMDKLTNTQSDFGPYSDEEMCWHDYDFPLDNYEMWPPNWNDLPEPVYPYHCTVEEEIDGTHVIVSTECGGTERLDEKVKRLIFSEKGEI